MNNERFKVNPDMGVVGIDLAALGLPVKLSVLIDGPDPSDVEVAVMSGEGGDWEVYPLFKACSRAETVFDDEEQLKLDTLLPPDHPVISLEDVKVCVIQREVTAAGWQWKEQSLPGGNWLVLMTQALLPSFGMGTPGVMHFGPGDRSACWREAREHIQPPPPVHASEVFGAEVLGARP